MSSTTLDEAAADPKQLIADLKRQLAESRLESDKNAAERDQAQAQLSATAEVLQVINSSPGDLAPVFDAMLEKAMNLCEAKLGFLSTYDGQFFDAVAMYGVPEAYASEYFSGPYMPAPGTTHDLIVRGEDAVHISDLAADPLDSVRRRAVIEMLGARTIIGIALRKERELVGALHIYRQEVRPFTDKQIALLQNFASQAVIAMENARLITETREALEQQTATAEVLQVINSSPGDLAPVFDAMLEKAMRLIGAAFGIANTYDGKLFRTAALHQVPPALALLWSSAPPEPGPNSALTRLASGEDVVHIEDYSAYQAYKAGDPRAKALVELGGVRTYLAVPLRKDGTLLGTIAAYRQEVRPYSEKQIALLQNFAAQAVIAMENARLITETREALEQQTATAEVLQVINSSPGDLTPVFEAILEKAHTLCAARFGSLQVYDGEEVRAVAARGLPAAFAARLREGFRPQADHPIRELLRGARMVQLDMAELDNEIGRAAFKLGGMRTVLFVPLRKDSTLLGYITAARPDVRTFSDKEIALLENFGAQAVIAMENARLLTETREALEQQTATAEVLGAINSSPGDLAPVFETMLEKAMRLCGAAFGMLGTYDGERFHVAALRGVPSVYEDFMLRNPPSYGPGTGPARLLKGEPLVHMLDMAADDAYQNGEPNRRALVDLGGARTGLTVPLLKEGAMRGFIMIYRQEVRPFSEKQIALLRSFAAQAVIAMENARLIDETREALDRQTATSELLGVINSSPGDLTPVFQSILEKAHALCGVAHGSLQLYDGERFYAVAVHNVSEPLAERLRQGYSPADNNSAQRLLDGEGFVHIRDLAEVDEPSARKVVELGGIRTLLRVSLRKEGACLGQIVAARREVRPFTNKQIELLQNFAAQAVIAMDNARLITETREALEQQTATAEVLGVINSSRSNLAPVFDVMLNKAMSLCEAAYGILFLNEGEVFRAAATRNLPPNLEDLIKEPFNPSPHGFIRRAARGQSIEHIADLREAGSRASQDPRAEAVANIGGARTTLSVALRKEGTIIGAFNVYRQEVRPFTDKQIALIENFAAQAVIAIDNARLLNEIRQRQAELRVTFDNMGDGVAMFDADLRLAAWNMNFQQILSLPEDFVTVRPTSTDLIRYLAQHGEFGAVDVEVEVRRISDRMGQQWSAERTRPDGHIIEVRNNPVPGGGFVLIYADITERKKAEQALQESEQRYVLAMEAINEAVYDWDITANKIYYSPRFYDLLGFRPGQLETPDDWVARIHLEDRPGYQAALLAHWRGETERFAAEYRFNHPDGRVLWFRHRGLALRDDEGRVYRMIGSGSDITEERALAAQLETAQQQLLVQQKMASLGQLTAGIAHEIKNPLNFVNNFAGLSVELLDELKETAAPGFATLDEVTRADINETVEMLTGNLEKIAEHGKRADGIVRSMLEHSRGASGERRAVDLNALVDEALNLAFHGARAQNQAFNITMEREFDRNLPLTEVVPQDMTRVFLNLIGNGFYAATKRKQQGETSFRPMLKVSTRDLGDAVEVRVRDNGVGIPPEHRDKLFQPFFTTKPTGEGTGLGLSISYDIVTQEHGGTIEVESEPGVFTEFIIRLSCRDHGEGTRRNS